MGLFKPKPNFDDIFHISKDLFEDGGSYSIVDQGDGTMLITIISTKPMALVGRDEWDALKEELAKSRKYADGLQATIKERDDEITKLKEEIVKLKKENKKFEGKLVEQAEIIVEQATIIEKQGASIVELTNKNNLFKKDAQEAWDANNILRKKLKVSSSRLKKGSGNVKA
jgi:hypothetical protein